jgi:hypothetical protein
MAERCTVAISFGATLTLKLLKRASPNCNAGRVPDSHWGKMRVAQGEPLSSDDVGLTAE